PAWPVRRRAAPGTIPYRCGRGRCGRPGRPAGGGAGGRRGAWVVLGECLLACNRIVQATGGEVRHLGRRARTGRACVGEKSKDTRPCDSSLRRTGEALPRLGFEDGDDRAEGNVVVVLRPLFGREGPLLAPARQVIQACLRLG